MLAFAFGQLTLALDIESQRTEADLAASGIDIFFILDGEWVQFALFIPIELRAVELAPAFIAADSIFEHRNVNRRHFTSCHCCFKESKPMPL